MMINQVIETRTYIYIYTYVQEFQPLYEVGAKALGGA
jgi:hypothetical protein